MVKISESGDTLIAVDKSPMVPDEFVSQSFVQDLVASPLYTAPTLLHNIEPVYEKIWTFARSLPSYSLTDVGTKILEVPSWCNSVMLLTVMDILASAGEGFNPATNMNEELALYGYVPATQDATRLQAETKIAKAWLLDTMAIPQVYRDLGDGVWEVLCRPVVLPTCGFKYVCPVFRGLACTEEDKPKTTAVKVWAIPINQQYHRPVI